MPITRSAKRALKKNARHHSRNLARKRIMKRTKKEYLLSINSNDKNLSKEKLQKLHKAIDKAAKRHVIHKNKANRLKSRLARKLKV